MSLKGASPLVALVVALAAGGALADTQERVVVFPLDGELSSSDRRLFDAMLRSDLRREATLELVPDDVRQVHVEATRSLGLGCESGAPVGAACASEVGRLAGAKWAIIGSGGADRAVELLLVDVERGATAAAASQILPPPGESFTPALRVLVPALLAPLAAARAPTEEADASADATAAPAALSPAAWWASSGALFGASALAAAAATGAFVAAAVLPSALQADDAPADRLAARNAWNAGGGTLAVLAGVSLVCGASLAVVGLVVGEPAE